jgi:general stress protein CsbA
MVLKVILALLLPFLLVILFTRVCYNHYVGTSLTAALLIASYVKGYTDDPLIISLDIISLVGGYLYARKMQAELIRKK